MRAWWIQIATRQWSKSRSGNEVAKKRSHLMNDSRSWKPFMSMIGFQLREPFVPPFVPRWCNLWAVPNEPDEVRLESSEVCFHIQLAAPLEPTQLEAFPQDLVRCQNRHHCCCRCCRCRRCRCRRCCCLSSCDFQTCIRAREVREECRCWQDVSCVLLLKEEWRGLSALFKKYFVVSFRRTYWN